MYLLTFPGVFAPSGLFHAGLQTAPWIYLFWHMGLPLAIFFYMLFETKYKGMQLKPPDGGSCNSADIVGHRSPYWRPYLPYDQVA